MDLTQTRYYQQHHITHKTGKKWMKGLLKHLHELAWTQWDYHNKTLYDPELKIQQQVQALLNRHIEDEYARGMDNLPP